MSIVNNYLSAVFLSDATAGSNHENINVNASGGRKYWKLTPESSVRINVLGVRLVAAISGSISTYANFLGVTITASTEIRLAVVVNTEEGDNLAVSTTEAFDYSSDHTYGFRSIGDLIASSVGQPTVLNINPGCVAFDFDFSRGIVLNGYKAASGNTADYLAISHAANLSGLNYMKAVAICSELIMP